MDIISEFESKVQNIWWEKVYSAREIMKIFWYDKWERFYWAILRAKEDLKDENKISKNFFFVTNKGTWWRPKEDVLLTLWACYFVLKRCDSRKENVKILILYLEDILRDKKNKKIKINIWWEKVLITFFIFFLFFSLVFYIKNYLNYLGIKNENELAFYNQKDIEVQREKQEEMEIKNDEVISQIKEVQEEYTFEDILKNYFDNWIKQVYKVDEDINFRNEFTQSLTWINLIKSFFLFWNNWYYRDSCSLLSKKDCLSASKSNLKDFSNYWEKTKNGYEILDIYKVDWELTNEKNIYCVKYKYKLRYDLSENDIIETFNFTTNTKNSFEQIENRFCEKIEKWWKNLKCPFKLENYYCN